MKAFLKTWWFHICVAVYGIISLLYNSICFSLGIKTGWIPVYGAIFMFYLTCLYIILDATALLKEYKKKD